MTRVTNIGRKRRYHEASDYDAVLASRQSDVKAPTSGTPATGPIPTESREAFHPDPAQQISAEGTPSTEKPKPKNKKRKTHSKKKKRTEPGDSTVQASEGNIGGDAQASSSIEKKTGPSKKSLKRKAFEEKRTKTLKDRAMATEKRRLERIQERKDQTMCFACREIGHSAKECPNTTFAPDQLLTLEAERDKSGKQMVGICYRCGSTKHTLSKCRTPENPDNPLPFADCFVCGQRGHLAGKCPKNATGVYPRGGNCKLCRSIEHLAKDCPLNKIEQAPTAFLLQPDGHGADMRPDEDDFHTLNRRREGLRVQEKTGRRIALLEGRAGAETDGGLDVIDPARQVKRSKVVKF